MRKYNYEEIKQEYKKQISIWEKQLYIINIIQDDLKSNPKAYKNINKNIKEYIEKLFENKKYKFEIRYYNDNNDYHIKKDITFYSDNNFSYNLQLSLINKRYDENYIISLEDLENSKERITKWIKEKNDTLKVLKTNVNKFNKLMDKLEEIYNVSDDFKYILEVKTW